MVHLCLFFFQAEDGIRDFHVTGVQTCALPIFAVTTAEVTDRKGALQALEHCRPSLGKVQSLLCDSGYTGEPFAEGVRRSEERRVGKECRSRGSPQQYKKKIEAEIWSEDDSTV